MQCRGFQLLSKMGYQPGQGLGKTASGAAVPIAVEIKSKRTGLGVDEANKERQARQAEMQLLRGIAVLMIHEASPTRATHHSLLEHSVLCKRKAMTLTCPCACPNTSKWLLHACALPLAIELMELPVG